MCSDMKNDNTKSVTMNLRVSPALKAIIQIAAKREHRSLSNMIEFLVLEYCERHGLTFPDEEPLKK